MKEDYVICGICGDAFALTEKLVRHEHSVHFKHEEKCKHKEDGMVKCAVCDGEKTWEDSQKNRMGLDDFEGKTSD